MSSTPFQIAIQQHAVDDLAARLRAARWPNVIDPETEELGLSLSWLQHAAEH